MGMKWNDYQIEISHAFTPTETATLSKSCKELDT